MTLKQAAQSVSVAQDVLRHLNALRLSQGVYVSNHGSYKEGENVTDLLPTIRANCDVCALGACFISLLDMTGTPYIANSLEELYGLDIEKMQPLLRAEMGERNVALIETAFEAGGAYLNYDGAITSDEYADAVQFGKRYCGSRACLRAIMENVVANRGMFTPGEVDVTC